MACAGRKASHPARAMDLYTGVMYQTYRTHAMAGAEPSVMILSAEHGFLAPSDVIAPYERKMDRARSSEMVGCIGDLVDPARWPVGIEAVQLCGGILYRRIMTAAVDVLKAAGNIAPAAFVGSVSGGIGQQRAQLGEYLNCLASPAACPSRKIVGVRPAGAHHQVVTHAGAVHPYRRVPCSDCPWREDAAGAFPAEAFRHSASTAYDQAQDIFVCHQSGTRKPAVCAGFLLHGAHHNLAVRLRYLTGRIKDDLTAGGHALHHSYRAMAEANGVDPEDPVLIPCRST